MNPVGSQTIPIPKALDSKMGEEEEEEMEVPQQQNEEEIKATDPKSDDYYAGWNNNGALLALRSRPSRPPRPFYQLSDSDSDDDSDEELAKINLTREEWNAYLEKYPGVDPLRVKRIRFSECVHECIAAFERGDPPNLKSRRQATVSKSDYCDDPRLAHDGFIEEYGGGFKDEDADGFKDEIVVNSVDDFDQGYTSKVRRQNEEIKAVVDPDYSWKIFEEEEKVTKHKEEIKDPGYSLKTEDKLGRLAKREALFALRRSSYQFPARPPYYKPNSDSEEELADLYMTRQEWNAHLEKHPDAHPFHLKIKRYFECVKAGIKGELPPRKSRQAKSDDDSDYELSEDDSVGCLSGIYGTRRLAEECGGGSNGENNPHFTHDIGFTDGDDDDYADDEDDDDDFTDDEDDDDDFTDDEDDDGFNDEIVVNSGTSSAPAASNMGE